MRVVDLITVHQHRGAPCLPPNIAGLNKTSVMVLGEAPRPPGVVSSLILAPPPAPPGSAGFGMNLPAPPPPKLLSVD